MGSNVLPLFWHLASSSRETRLAATADLVSSVEAFQRDFVARGLGEGEEQNKDDEDDEEDGDEDEDDDDDDDEEKEKENGDGEDSESGIEVDESDDDDNDDDIDEKATAEIRRLDAKLARDNAQDVVYCVKRLVRGLGSSRESSRLGFAVALTELLARTPTVSAAQALSLISRNSQYGKGGKGSDERDMMFARLFGLVALSNSGTLFSSSARLADFVSVIDLLIALSDAKAWMTEAAGWAILRTTQILLESNVEWKEEAIAYLTDALYVQDKGEWSSEKIALTLVLEAARPDLDWKTFLAPTFKHSPLLASQNLVALGRILKEGSASSDDDNEPSTSRTGTYKPRLHFVWDTILAAYFQDGKVVEAADARAPFADVFRVVVDESLFANTSSAERKYWGFQVFDRALPMLPSDQVPLVFTPNFMRCWMNNLGVADRHLHKAALQTARVVQDLVKANPAASFALLSQLVGKHGRPDFDRVTKTKTVETIMANLTAEGVSEYVAYLEGVILGKDAKDASDPAALEDRRVWALDQLVSLCRNGAVPKTDAWVSRLLDFLLVHGFFIVRKADKASKIEALHSTPKPAFSEATAAICRSRFFSALVEVTAATPAKTTDGTPQRRQGADAAGKLWLTRALDVVSTLEADKKHVELATDADEEIKKMRLDARAALDTVRKAASGDKADVARGVEILISFLILQTYDEVEDALDLLEEATGAAKGLFKEAPKKRGRKAKGAETPVEQEDDVAPIDAFLDVLIAQLDKNSADLRQLANLVFGMVTSALTATSIQHLVANLEQSGAQAEAEDAEDDEDEEMDEDEDEEEAGEDEEDEESDDADSIVIESDDDEDGEVDPEFRKRVADALKASGMAVDSDDEDGDDDSDAESEVWDDEQMMKVDEQLAAVFRQRATANKKSDLKHAAIESLHFKNRILDFFDVYARKQATNPLVLDIIIPLLQLVRSASGELSNKGAAILRTRFAKTKEHPSPVDAEEAKRILGEIHSMAQRAASPEFSALCSSASLFVARASPGPALEAYGATLTDYMTRKHSSVHPSFLMEFIRRYPSRAWALAADLVRYAGPDAGSAIKVPRQMQGYTMLAALFQQLPQLVKASDVDLADATALLSQAASDAYAVFELAAASEDAQQWTTSRLKDVGKFALQTARAAKAVDAASAAQTCDATRVAAVVEKLKAGTRTADIKSVQGLLAQVEAVLGSSSKAKGKGGAKGEATGKGKKANGETKGKTVKAIEVEEDEDEDEAKETKDKSKKRKAPAKASKSGKKARQSV